MTAWRYQIVGVLEEGKRVYCLAEVYLNDGGEPCAFCDIDLTYMESPQKITDDLKLMRRDAENFPVLEYPDDFGEIDP